MPSNTVTKLLIARRHLYDEQLKEVEEFTSCFIPGNNISELQNRNDALIDLKNEFKRLSLEITEKQLEVDEKYTPDYKDMTEFSSRWYKVCSQIQDFIASGTTPFNQALNRGGNPAEQQQKVRLPEVSLPKFSGSCREWSLFFDAFNSLIYENTILNNCQKLHYLKSCLRGEASRCIESLAISDTNYTAALTLLQKPYKNERLIVQSHVQSILNTAEINKALAENLRKLIDNITANTETLRVLKIQIYCVRRIRKCHNI